jgi:hypothetical protein
MLRGPDLARVNVEFAKTASKVLVLLDRNVLVPKEDDQIVDQGGVDRIEGAFVERFRQIHTKDLRADVGRHLSDIESLRAHGHPARC